MDNKKSRRGAAKPLSPPQGDHVVEQALAASGSMKLGNTTCADRELHGDDVSPSLLSEKDRAEKQRVANSIFFWIAGLDVNEDAVRPFQNIVQGDTSQPLLPEENQQEEGAVKQRLAVKNVRNVFGAFLYLDFMCAASFASQCGYGQTVLPGQSPAMQLASRILPYILTVTFSIDIILAITIMKKIKIKYSDDPCWEKHACIVECNFISNAMTFCFLAAQRCVCVASLQSMSAFVLAFAYLSIRCVKLYPLFMLRASVKAIDLAGAGHTKYEKLWAYWAKKRRKSYVRQILRFARVFCLVSFVIVVVVLFYLSVASGPKGAPPPGQMLQRIQNGSTAVQTSLASHCDSNRCRIHEKIYYCTRKGDCPKQCGYVGVSSAFNIMKTAGHVGGGAYAGAAAGVGCCALWAPEISPACALIGAGIGALGGTAAVTYEVEGDYDCLESTDGVPKTARDILWCADCDGGPCNNQCGV